jgi:hypothetical protein
MEWLDCPLQFMYAAEDQARADEKGNGKQQDCDTLELRIGWQSARAQGPAPPPAPKPPRPPALSHEQRLEARETRTAAAIALDLTHMRQLAAERLPPELHGGLWDKLMLASRAQRLEILCSIAAVIAIHELKFHESLITDAFQSTALDKRWLTSGFTARDEFERDQARADEHRHRRARGQPALVSAEQPDQAVQAPAVDHSDESVAPALRLLEQTAAAMTSRVDEVMAMDEVIAAATAAGHNSPETAAAVWSMPPIAAINDVQFDAHEDVLPSASSRRKRAASSNGTAASRAPKRVRRAPARKSSGSSDSSSSSDSDSDASDSDSSRSSM